MSVHFVPEDQTNQLLTVIIGKVVTDINVPLSFRLRLGISDKVLKQFTM